MNLVRISHRLEITFWNKAIDIMNNPHSLRVFSASMIVAMIFGLVFLAFGVFIPRDPVASGREIQPPNAVILPKPGEQVSRRQYNILVMLVDEISSAPKNGLRNLKAVWFAAYLPSQTKLMLMPAGMELKMLSSTRLLSVSNIKLLSIHTPRLKSRVTIF